MSKEVIDINFSSLNSSINKLQEISKTLETNITTISDISRTLDSRVKKHLSEKYDVTNIEKIKDRIDKISAFLGEVIQVYGSDDISLSDTLTWEKLEVIYPEFSNLSDERKAIILTAFRYLSLKGPQVANYSKNFQSMYENRQMTFDGTGMWCANFVGSIINFYYGDQSILDPAYASVYKLFGAWGEQIGFSLESDERINYYLSRGTLNHYRNSEGQVVLPSGWESQLQGWNRTHGTDLHAYNWVDEDFVPSPGDVIQFHRPFKNDKGETVYTFNPTLASSGCHTGFVLGTRIVDGRLIIDTIEGNVNDDVQVRSFEADTEYIVGYAHIDYEKFQGDTNAINEILNTGIDTSQTKATVGMATRNLIGFTGSIDKQAYLYTKAKTVGVEETATVTIDTNNTVDKTNTITTSKDTNTVHNVVSTSNNTNNNSYNYSYSSTTSNQSIAKPVETTTTVVETKPVETTTTVVEPKPVEETKPVKDVKTTTTEVEHKQSLLEYLNERIKTPEPKQESIRNEITEQEQHIEERIIEEKVEEKIEQKPIETKSTTTIKNNNVIKTTKQSHSTKTPKASKPTYDVERDEYMNYENAPIDNNFKEQDLIDPRPDLVNPTIVEPHEETIIDPENIIVTPPVETPTETPEYQQPEYTEPEYHEPVVETPTETPKEPTTTSEKPPVEPVLEDKENHTLRNITLAGLGIAAGGAIYYSYNKYKKNNSDSEEDK